MRGETLPAFGARPSPSLVEQLGNPANLVTLARLAMVPAIVWLIGIGADSSAFALLLVAGLSDALDGWLARRFGASTLGAALDPLADKALLISLYLALAMTRHLPIWLASIVVARDLVILTAIVLLWLMRRAVTIRPLMISKANTALQIAFVVLVVGLLAIGVAMPALVLGFASVVAATTVVSGAAYAAGLWPKDWPRIRQ